MSKCFSRISESGVYDAARTSFSPPCDVQPWDNLIRSFSRVNDTPVIMRNSVRVSIKWNTIDARCSITNGTNKNITGHFNISEFLIEDSPLLAHTTFQLILVKDGSSYFVVVCQQQLSGGGEQSKNELFLAVVQNFLVVVLILNSFKCLEQKLAASTYCS